MEILAQYQVVIVKTLVSILVYPAMGSLLAVLINVLREKDVNWYFGFHNFRTRIIGFNTQEWKHKKPHIIAFTFFVLLPVMVFIKLSVREFSTLQWIGTLALAGFGFAYTLAYPTDSSKT